MTGLLSLWLPILLSAVIVFIASSIIHMATPWHKGDYGKLPSEEQVLSALRPFSIPPGDYMAPIPASMKDLNSPEFTEKRTKGPVLIMTVLPNGPVAMGPSLAMWFLYSIVIAVFAGYIAGTALPPHTQYLKVFQFVGTTAFIGYTFGLWQMAIWYRRSLTTTVKSTIDGLIYALLMAGTFGWLWPK